MDNKNNNENTTHYLPLGMCIGLSIGVGIGAATNNIPTWMCMGLGIGMCFGSVIDMKNREKEAERGQNEEVLDKQDTEKGDKED